MTSSGEGGGDLVTVRLLCEEGTALDPSIMSELLMDSGALSVTVQRGGSQPPGAGQLPEGDSSIDVEYEERGHIDAEKMRGRYWKSSDVVAMFPKDCNVKAVMEFLQDTLELERTPTYQVGSISASIDWMSKIQQEWPPIHIGNLTIRFPWHESDTDRGEGDGVKTLVLEGGPAFGTGDHPTTRLCCLWMQKVLREMKEDAPSEPINVLDYGSGSGVLTLAAVLFGASHAVGIEIDPASLTSSRRNADINNLTHVTSFSPPPPFDPTLRLDDDASSGEDDSASEEETERMAAQWRAQFVQGGEGGTAGEEGGAIGGGRFHVVVANIQARPLVRLASVLAAMSAPGARLALSGVTTPRASMVVDAYRRYFDNVRVERDEDEWVLITGTRKQT